MGESGCGTALLKPVFPDEKVLSLMLLNVLAWVCLSTAPDGPPMDVTLQPMTSQSIQVTWKVSRAGVVHGVSLGMGTWAAADAILSLCSGGLCWGLALRQWYNEMKTWRLGVSSAHCTGLLFITISNKLIIS